MHTRERATLVALEAAPRPCYVETFEEALAACQSSGSRQVILKAQVYPGFVYAPVAIFLDELSDYYAPDIEYTAVAVVFANGTIRYNDWRFNPDQEKRIEALKKEIAKRELYFRSRPHLRQAYGSTLRNLIAELAEMTSEMEMAS